ncbi:MAG: cytochrome b N-terminal domain-containing protein [Pseudolysinimonas sp.]
MTTAADRRPQLTEGWAERLGRARAGTLLAEARTRVAADPWAVLLAQIVISSFVVVTLTGLFLMFFYVPSTAPATYHGSYQPLNGVEMSVALQSTLDLSFDVRGGLLVRQLHNWGSSLMLAAVLLLIARIFFTGAFRSPRRLSWLVVFAVLVVAMAAGFTGMALPDDMLSGTSLAILHGVLQSIPVVGSWLAALLFGGGFPGDPLALFYSLHVIVLPLALAGLLAAGLLSAGARPLRRRAAVRSAGILVTVAGVLALMGAFATVNPVWLYGPSDPGNATAGAGPVWYLAFVDGALRLIPPGWEIVAFGRTWTLAVLAPAAIATLFLLTIAVYPFAERWATGDRRDHPGPSRARDYPARTAIGVAGIAFYVVLWAAAGSDTIATQFGLSIESVLLTMQVLALGGPLAAGALAWRIALELRSRSLDVARHGFETGRIVRLPGGEYVEIHAQLPATQRLELEADDRPRPIMLRPDENGQIGVVRRAQAVASRLFWRGVDE